MGIFDRFPYSSTHEMNLDFMLGKATEIAEDMQTVATGMAQVQAGLSAISEKTEQATQAAAQAAQSASSIEGSVTAAEEAAEEAQMHNESAQTWANNAMTYKADCQRSATEAAASATSAAQAATAAAGSEDTVAQYAQAANASAQSAANNNDSAHQYANQASASASNATFHSSNAQAAATNANTSATNAETAATNAQTAATRTAALKDDCETLHRMCTTAVDLAAEQAVAAANSAAQAAASKTDVENLVESLPEDFTDLNNTVNQLSDEIDSIFSVDFSENGYINNNGENAGTGTAFRRTDYISLSGVLFGIEYALCLASNGNIVSYYDETKTYLGGVPGADNNTIKTGMLVYPDTAKYVRFSYCVASAGITNPDPIVRLKDIAQNADVGYKAVKTPNIGDSAVTREKCNFIIHDPETNYIDKSKYSNGYINASGVFISNDGWRATGFCALLPETQYFSGGLHGGYCAFYKADKTTVIAGYGANAFTVSNFTTPAETAYARFSLNASSQSVDTAWINTKNEKPEDYGYILDGVGISSNDDNPCDYDGREIAVFNKILCVGDSMTEGTFNHLDSGSTQYINYAKYSYPAYLHKLTGVDVTNLGHSGQTSVQWYDTEQNNDLSGYDCAIIQLGINDYGTYDELGTDTKTAFQNIITKLKNENKNIKIFVANIIPATSYSSAGYKAYSAALLEWIETTYATDPNVIPVDIQQYGHTGNSSAFNAGHLTALGYRMLARDYIGFISSYIKNNGSIFREVQFIGTDYWYTNPNA